MIDLLVDLACEALVWLFAVFVVYVLGGGDAFAARVQARSVFA